MLILHHPSQAFHEQKRQQFLKAVKARRKKLVNGESSDPARQRRAASSDRTHLQTAPQLVLSPAKGPEEANEQSREQNTLLLNGHAPGADASTQSMRPLSSTQNCFLARSGSLAQVENLRLLRDQLAQSKQRETLGHMKRKDLNQLSVGMRVEELRNAHVQRTQAEKKQIDSKKHSDQQRLQEKLKRISDDNIKRREAQEMNEVERIRVEKERKKEEVRSAQEAERQHEEARGRAAHKHKRECDAKNAGRDRVFNKALTIKEGDLDRAQKQQTLKHARSERHLENERRLYSENSQFQRISAERKKKKEDIEKNRADRQSSKEQDFIKHRLKIQERDLAVVKMRSQESLSKKHTHDKKVRNLHTKQGKIEEEW